MAASSVIGALRVVLGLDAASLETGLKAASSQLAGFSSKIKTASTLLSAAAIGAFGALGLSIKSTLNQADDMAKTAQKIGVPIETLSKLKHAADLSGLSFEGLATGVGKLSKTMVEAFQKPTSEAASAFDTLKISVRDAVTGELRSSESVMLDIADRFQRMEDGAAKTTLAMQLFGKAGKDLIPLLNAGKVGLAEMFAEAEKLGIVFDQKTGKAAENFNDNLERLGKVKQGIIVRITAGLAPALDKLSKYLIDVAKDTDAWERASAAILSGLESLVRVAIVVKDNITLLGNALLFVIGLKAGQVFASLGLVLINFTKAVIASTVATTLFGAAKTLLTNKVGIFATALGIATVAIAGYTGKLEGFGETVGEFSKQATDAIGGQFSAALKALGFDLNGLAFSFKNVTSETPKATDDIKKFNAELTAGAKAAKDYEESIKKQIASQRIEVELARLSTGALEAQRVVLEGRQRVIEAGGTVDAAFNERLRVLAGQAGAVALQLKGVQLIQENLSPTVAYQKEMANTTEAMTLARASSEQLALAQEKVRDKFGESSAAIGTAIGSIAGSMSNLLGTVAKDNKALGLASKAFGIAQVIINTQIAITKALATLGPIGGPIAAAAMAAQGAASVAAIVAQGFARGGSFRVGGVGGMDSQLVQFMATPGEMVDVRTPGQAGTPATGGGGGSREIMLRGRRLTDMLTLEDVRDLVETLNRAHRDGYKLKVGTT